MKTYRCMGILRCLSKNRL